MESRSTNRMMLALIVLLFGAAIYGFIRWLSFNQQLSDNPWQNYKADLLARAHSDVLDARKNWNARKVPHYRLEIVRAQTGQPDAPTCRQDVEVKDETVVTTYDDTCTAAAARFDPAAVGWQPPDPHFPATVSQLFALAERDTAEIFWTAEGVGCDFISLSVSYDPQLGYPSRLAYTVQPPPQQMGFPIKAEYFRQGEPAPAASGCVSALIPDGPVITVKLTPMQ